jgi:hypothetical protein
MTAMQKEFELAVKAEGFARQSIAHYLELCNPMVAGDTQKYLRKLAGTAQRQADELDDRADLRIKGAA